MNNHKTELYNELSSASLPTSYYHRADIREDMELIDESMGGWWKHRYLLDHRRGVAYELITDRCILTFVADTDIDYDSMPPLPPKARETLEWKSFRYPSFFSGFHNGIARVEWQLVPDGRYYRDEDGYGMTDDEELNIYGFIDRELNVVSKFRYYTDEERRSGILDRVRLEAEKKISSKYNFLKQWLLRALHVGKRR